MRRVLHGLCVALCTAAPSCAEPSEPDAMEEPMPLDVQALLWCLPTRTSGETANGETVIPPLEGKDTGACLCLPVGTQPSTGSELNEILYQMAIDQCIEDLEALGAVTTPNCERLIPDRPIDYESACDLDQWPPPPT